MSGPFFTNLHAISWDDQCFHTGIMVFPPVCHRTQDDNKEMIRAPSRCPPTRRRCCTMRSFIMFGIQQFHQLLISFSDTFGFSGLHALPWKQQGVLTGIVMLPPCLNRTNNTANNHQQNDIQTHHVE